MKQFLKPEVLQKVKEDEPLRMKIALAMGKKFRTVDRWVSENHIMLSHSTVLDTIRAHYAYKVTEQLTETETAIAA